VVNLPGLYFRLREPGALVFRVDAGTARGRLDLEPLAIVNLRSGEVRPQGAQVPSAEDEAEIAAWVQARRAEVAAREAEDIRRTVEQINQTAHWAQTRASDAEIDAVSQDLLLAMHDLRLVQVRRRSALVPDSNAD
jgi:hypothetical protein